MDDDASGKGLLIQAVFRAVQQRAWQSRDRLSVSWGSDENETRLAEHAPKIRHPTPGRSDLIKVLMAATRHERNILVDCSRDEVRYRDENTTGSDGPRA